MAAFADRNADAERDVHDALSDWDELRRVFGYQDVRADEEVEAHPKFLGGNYL